MFSPYFNQSYQSFYQPKPQPDFPANRSFSTSQVSALSQPNTATKEDMKSGLSSFDSLLTSSLFKEDSKEVKSLAGNVDDAQTVARPRRRSLAAHAEEGDDRDDGDQDRVHQEPDQSPQRRFFSRG